MRDYYCRPLINKPPALNRDYNGGPNTKAFKRRGFMNHGSTLGLMRVAGCLLGRFPVGRG